MNQLDPANFFFKIPIYEEIQVNPENWNHFIRLIQFKDRVDGYNPIRGKTSTFIGSKRIDGEISRGNLDYLFSYGVIFALNIKCLRYEDEFEYFVKYTPIRDKDEDGDEDWSSTPKNGVIMKVGQYPSVVDFHIHNLDKVKKALSKEKQREFSRAVGLVSHGVGIGSFVYLRRIFEELIEEAHKLALTSTSWNDEPYQKSRMNEKIQLLKDYLPEFLVTNQAIYSILSKGIHELSEDECLQYFDPIRVGIELILEEKLEKIDKMRRLAEATKKIDELKKNLR